MAPRRALAPTSSVTVLDFCNVRAGELILWLGGVDFPAGVHFSRISRLEIARLGKAHWPRRTAAGPWPAAPRRRSVSWRRGCIR
eukprot:752791-Hanusia_phi.AAC.2